MGKEKKKRKSRRVSFGILMILLVIAAAYYTYTYVRDMNNKPKLSGDVEVHFIDVGQGDSCLIVSPTGSTVLIDAGDEKTSKQNEHPTIEYLDELKVTTIDYMIITHYDQDHIGGADDVINAVEVKNFLTPDYVPTTKCGERLMTAIENEGAEVVHPDIGYSIDLGGNARLEVLSSAEITDNGRNNDSIVTRLTYGDISFLFTGDAESEREEELLESCPEKLESDVLKAGHHGSDSSSTEDFLKEVSPEVAIISCGKDNSYGHPHEKTLKALSSLSCKILRTDLLGDIILTTDGDVISSNQSQNTYGQIVSSSNRSSEGALSNACVFSCPVNLTDKLRKLPDAA